MQRQQLREPRAAFGEEASLRTRSARGRGKLQAPLCIFRIDAPAQRSAQIVVLAVESLQGCRLFAAEERLARSVGRS